MDTEKKFNQILEDSRNDDNIIAFWLDGSRGKGMITEYSDYDCTMIVKDEVLVEYKSKYEKLGNLAIELKVMTLNEFKTSAGWTLDKRWERYNYAHIKPLVDKTGQLQELFYEKASIPDKEMRSFINVNLDHYINQVYRSLKCFRDNKNVGARLEAANSIIPLLNVIFGLHNRLCPYYKYFEWELEKFPLEKLSLSSEEFTKSVLMILENGDMTTQQRILKEIENVSKKEGYKEIWNSWDAKLEWMKSFNSD